MAQLLKNQRRLLLLATTTLLTLLIRMVLVPLGSVNRVRAGSVVYSDRGRIKQVAFRFTKYRSPSGLIPSIRLGFSQNQNSTPYLLRVANFSPFLRLENLGAPSDLLGASPLHQVEPMLFQCDDGDGSDGDGDDSEDGGQDSDGDDSIC
ncbi:hypothetical protein EDE15_4240 [Edaphobacter aggregans]|uniref:Uncharacterized protein n=1 Tax=Edaphobacter aggregans TaxID=570835 RepID=A0A428MNZ5_9BACT|nr:hypothetical protein EDE15_4240 [Edaphobacter aggregans]